MKPRSRQKIPIYTVDAAPVAIGATNPNPIESTDQAAWAREAGRSNGPRTCMTTRPKITSLYVPFVATGNPGHMEAKRYE
jgi:hypothetical protein